MTTPDSIDSPVVSLDRQEGWAEPEARKTGFGTAADNSNILTNRVCETDAAMGAISPKQPSRLFPWFGIVRWAGSLMALALAPKCLLCVAGYLGFATGLGLVNAELCGGTVDSAGRSLRNVVPALGVAGLSIFAVLRGQRFFRNRSNIPVRNDECGSLE